ncbi:MAG: histidine triad nucleotide-binding protein, partial [Candidatus Limnocylindrales bacterium]
MTNVQCVFCRIIAGEIPTEFLHNDELVVAFRDITPKAPTHLLLMPREHVVSAADLQDAHGPMLGRLFSVAANLARETGIAESGFRLVTNSGKGAGQSVPHLHFHLLGGRSMRWPPG